MTHREHERDENRNFDLPQVIEQLIILSSCGGELPDEGAPLGRTTRAFFENNWSACGDLLAKTDKIRVEPLTSEAPSAFRFEIDLPYKRSVGPDGALELAPGPIRGLIRYRPDLYSADPNEPAVLVTLDRDQALIHPNYSRRHGILCTGDLPPGPFPLEDLLEHIYRILSYQAWSLSDPADPEAARYFAEQPGALDGLGPVEPLYGARGGC